MTDEARRPGCLDANMMGEYIDGGLEPRQRAEVEAHLAECGECYENFSETVRMSAVESATTTSAPPATPVPQKPMSRWYAWAAAAVIVVTGSTAGLWWMNPNQRALRQLDIIASSGGSSRPALGRLSGPFTWKPERQTTRGTESAEASLTARTAALALEALVAEHPSAATLHARGLALLSMGDVDSSIAALTSALSAADVGANESQLRSDLGAALIERWRQYREPQDAARGLSEIEIALSEDPHNPAALFNRALALGAIGLKSAEAAAWATFLAQEPQGAWADEARQRMKSAGNGTAAPPKDAALLSDDQLRDLASAHAAWVYDYIEDRLIPDAAAARGIDEPTRATASRLAMALVVAHREPGAVQSLTLIGASARWPAARQRCLLDALGGLSRWKRLWADGRRPDALAAAEASAAAFRCAKSDGVAADAAIAWSQNYINGPAGEGAAVDALIDRAESSGHWRAAADLLRMSGATQLGAGRSRDAQQAFERGLAVAERAGDEIRVALLRTNIAGLAAEHGEYALSWRQLASSFALLASPALTDVTRYSIVSSGVSTASREGLAGAVLALSTAMESETARWSRDDARIYGALRRAQAYVSLDAPAQVDRELQRAAELIARIPDASLRTGWQAELDVTRGFARIGAAPDVATASLTEAVAELRSQGRAFRVAELLLGKGRALARMARSRDARAAWEEGVTVFEEQREGIKNADLSVARTAELWDLYGELIDATLAEPSVSLHYVERSRARQLLDRIDRALETRTPPISVAEFQAQLRPRERALVYLVEPQRLIIWIVSSQRVSVETRDITPSALTELISAHRQALRAGRAGTTALTALLIPASALDGADALIVVPDGTTFDACLSALTMADGRFLVEHAALTVAPSLTSFVAASKLAGSSANRRSTVLGFAGPVPDRHLPAIAGVADEVARVSALYADHRTFVGSAATGGALFKAAVTSDILHIAAHATPDRRQPARATIWLARDDEFRDGGVSVSALRALVLPLGATVVLSACETAVGQTLLGEGSDSLVTTFLAAGAGLVVGTLWPIEDQHAAGAFERLHRALRERRAFSVSDTQRQLIAAGRAPVEWAALVAYGGRI